MMPARHESLFSCMYALDHVTNDDDGFGITNLRVSRTSAGAVGCGVESYSTS